MVEVLILDFQGRVDLVQMVIDEAPEVIAQHRDRRAVDAERCDPRAGYTQSLEVLAAIKAADPARYTKSSIMVGWGRPRKKSSRQWAIFARWEPTS